MPTLSPQNKELLDRLHVAKMTIQDLVLKTVASFPCGSMCKEGRHALDCQYDLAFRYVAAQNSPGTWMPNGRDLR